MVRYSRVLENRFRRHGPKIGYCVLCRKKRRLSKDHVPPASCGNKKDVIRQTISTFFEHEGDRKPHPTIQGGSHFRTLCSTCNSLLGKEYDTELKSLYDHVSALFRAREQGFFLPPKGEFPIKPQRLARCILGHMLAAYPVEAVLDDEQLPIEETISSYVLNPSSSLPADLNLYYWYYPYSPTVVANTMGKMILFPDRTVSFTTSLLKFTPFAFWLVFKKPEGLRIHFPTLASGENRGLDEEAGFILDFERATSQHWPEMPRSNEATLTSEPMTSISIPKPKKPSRHVPKNSTT